ncbi:MAG: TolC family protein [Myxococcales bacterium]|nr:TolC family protein [Myxococcales bacterium]
MLAALLLAQILQPVRPVEPPARSSIREPLPAPVPEAPPEGPVLPLAEALAQLRDRSPDLAVALERVTQAQNNVQRAWATVQPTLTATGTVTHNSYSGAYIDYSRLSITSTGPNTQSAAINFNWNIFNYRAVPALQTAYQQVEVARLTETQQRRELLLDVASTYYAGLALKELAAVAARQAKATRDHAIEAQARYEAGLIQLSAALRARIDYLRADQETRRAQFNYAASRSQLAALLDRRDTAFELAPPAQPPEEIRGAFKDLIAKALEERPEMAAARANEEIAARLKTDAWAQFLPSLALTANARYNHPVAASTIDASTWAFALTITLPIYDGGFRYVALKDADSQMRQARAQTRSEASRIEDELRRAQLDLESARALRDEAEQALAASRENERLVRAQFAAGTASQVEVSDAEAALFQSESTALQQRLSVQIAALRVAKAVGAFDLPEAAK